MNILSRRMKIFIDQVTVYPVSCEPLCAGRNDMEWLEGVLAGGARIVQLRDKVSDDRTLYQKALMFREKTRAAGALFMVNNRVDIAILADADGVHLGNRDIPAAAARKLLPEKIIGISANHAEQARSAESNGASYYNIGPLFPTSTKTGLHKFLGSAAIAEWSKRSDLPFTVMGGIKFDHLDELIAAGAVRIAVVTAISQAADIATETERWIKKISTRQG